MRGNGLLHPRGVSVALAAFLFKFLKCETHALASDTGCEPQLPPASPPLQAEQIASHLEHCFLFCQVGLLAGRLIGANPGKAPGNIVSTSTLSRSDGARGTQGTL